MKDVEEFFAPKLKQIIEMAEQAGVKAQGYPISTKEKPDISVELLYIVSLSDELMNVIDPDRKSGEYFGMPRENIVGAQRPRKIQTNDGIDFTPWFAEKIRHIKDGAKDASKHWMVNVEDVYLREDAPFTPEEFVLESITGGLERAKIYAQTVLDMIERKS